MNTQESMNTQENNTIYLVVFNLEERSSIWSKWKKEIPAG